MGTYYQIHCEKCRYKMDVGLDIGMAFPMVYRYTIEEARSGELGEEIQKFFAENPNGAIDVSRVLSVCQKCDHIELVKDLTMYLPNTDVSMPEKGNSAWSVAFPFKGVSYVAPCDLKEYYKRYSNYPHKCKKCSGNVKILTKENIEKYTFKCPKCGNPMHAEWAGVWD